MSQSKFPYEPWNVTENGFVAGNLPENESAFAIGNGFIGMRGNLEEGTATGAESVQATLLNGVFDSEPIVYGETAYGYAKNHETICNVMDAKSIRLTADGEALDMGVSAVKNHVRTLDMKAGQLVRSFVWSTRSGAELKVTMRRMVSLTELHTAFAVAEVECLSGSAELVFESAIRPAVINQGDPNDPRNSAGKDRTLLVPRAVAIDDSVIAMEQRTKHTDFSIACAVSHRFAGETQTAAAQDSVSWWGSVALAEGESVTLEKVIAYVADTTAAAEQSWEQAVALAKTGEFAPAAKAQQDYLDEFWLGAGMSIEGDDALLQGLRFNIFQLLQSAGRDGKHNIAAKGLTGEGYEGHIFWDTEGYILPVFLHTEPMVARKLLEYRYSILPNARNRARIMGHDKGALFAWRTIDGEECSAYFPAGSAQYHIDGDIAHAVWDYWYTTRDLDFLAKYGAEILVETARFYHSLGFYSEAKGGRFVINCVTGPDEYNVLVNNNTYTNKQAQANFRTAAEAMGILQTEAPADYARLCESIGYTEAETTEWLAAADGMYFPPVTKDGIYPQDDEFLNRKPWPLDTIPANHHPLLMYYHGLVIYRHMVCKQADLILAMTLFGQDYTLEDKKKNFAFYDSVTTHDSSLSMAVFSILAAEIGEMETAYNYFMSSARLDLDDMHHNSRDGLHMANMAGAWNCITKGFGGMRYLGDTLSFAPVCPPQWKGYSFRVRFRGRTVDVHVTAAGAEYKLVSGEPLTILAGGKPVELKAE